MDTTRRDMSLPQEEIPDFGKYSPRFQEIVRTKGMERLLRECHFEGSFEAWKEQRETAAKLIHKDGKILDFGCANGFLLACLREWSGKELECYGIDSDSVAIEHARELFPENAEEHFPFMTEEAREKLPKKFETIYWNVWDNVNFTDERRIVQLKKLEEHAKGGRIILGFYHPSPDENKKKLRDLQGGGYAFAEVIRDQNGHIFAALDISEDTPHAA